MGAKGKAAGMRAAIGERLEIVLYPSADAADGMRASVNGEEVPIGELSFSRRVDTVLGEPESWGETRLLLCDEDSPTTEYDYRYIHINIETLKDGPGGEGDAQ